MRENRQNIFTKPQMKDKQTDQTLKRGKDIIPLQFNLTKYHTNEIQRSHTNQYIK